MSILTWISLSIAGLLCIFIAGARKQWVAVSFLLAGELALLLFVASELFL